MASADELRAALKVAELEEALVKAKGTKAGASSEDKAQLRAARQAHREQRSGGEGVAQPDTVRASAQVKES